jgi:hypothetical protein
MNMSTITAFILNLKAEEAVIQRYTDHSEWHKAMSVPPYPNEDLALVLQYALQGDGNKATRLFSECVDRARHNITKTK